MRFIILTIAALAMMSSGSILAATYEHGHNALQVFDQHGMKNTPTWVMAWIAFMMSTFLFGLIFIRQHVIARWVVGGLFMGIIVGLIADKVFDVPPLSGFIALLHVIFWSPGLYLLMSKRPFMQAGSAYSRWCAVITAVILFSFLFDIKDASIYLMHLL